MLVNRDGRTRTPGLYRDFETRFWPAIARLDSGVFLWGGVQIPLDAECTYRGDGERTDTGWFSRFLGDASGVTCARTLPWPEPGWPARALLSAPAVGQRSAQEPPVDSIPIEVAVPLVLAVIVVDGLALLDLRRVAEVRQAPKWAWALVILLSFPLGAILYVLVGRDPEGQVVERAWVPSTPAASADPSPGEGQPAATDEPPVVTTTDLVRTFGDTVALDHVDIVVPRGAIYGLIGPNGAGKTTLLSLLTGLRRPTAGSVEVAVDRRRVALLPDTPSFEPWLTAREVVDLARCLQAPDSLPSRVDEVLAEVGLSDVADRRVSGFSRGMLQRVGLASCLVSDPDLLLLDEPSSALDPAGRREVLDLVQRLAGDRTVVLSTHILPDVQRVCDTVGVLDDGRLLYQGAVSDLLQRTSSTIHVTIREPSEPVVTALRASPAVTQVDRIGPGQLVVRLTDATAAELTLPQVLAAADARLVSLVPATDLETAFLELTS